MWSLQCPRYHKDVQYNRRQLLLWDSVATDSATYQSAIQKKRLRSEPLSLTTVEQTTFHRKKVKAETRSNLSDEETSQISSPADRLKGEHCWDILSIARGTALPELGQEVSVLETQASHTYYSSS